MATRYTDWLCRSCKREFLYSQPGRPNFCPHCRGQQLVRPDLLVGLSRRERSRRILEDVEFIACIANATEATAEGVAAAQRAGMPEPKLWDGRETPNAVVGGRVDLDTPMMFPDNIVTRCADCDCDIQLRPDAPKGPPAICICCCARRIREHQR